MDDFEHFQPCSHCLQISVAEDPGHAWMRAELSSLRDVLLEAKRSGRYVADPLIPLEIEPSPEIFRAYMASFDHTSKV